MIIDELEDDLLSLNNCINIVCFLIKEPRAVDLGSQI
jgi:hypothetical protein